MAPLAATPRAFVVLTLSLLLLSITRRDAQALSLSSSPPSAANKRALRVPANTKATPWAFQGHKVYAQVTEPVVVPKSSATPRKRCSVVLIHGFGCSTYYWRETCRALTLSTKADVSCTVHALDLLGQGQSDKPSSVQYSTQLWTDLVTTYVQERLNDNDEPLVFMGNSLGSVVALNAAISDCPVISNRVRGVGLFNCGVGMNSMNLLKDPSLSPLQSLVFGVLFAVLNTLIFGNLPLITYLLDKVVTKELLRNALISLYPCASPSPEDRVDDNLVDSFYYPAKDAGSPQALSQIYVNDAGPTPMELHEQSRKIRPQRVLGKDIPIHVIWGSRDGVTPLSGYVGQYYQGLANGSNESMPNVTLDVMEAGHIPFDEVPECNDRMVQWLNKVV